MTIIRCTRKLFSELRIKPDPDATTKEPGWHANLLFVDHKKCILFTHDQTLFSFFRCGLTQAEFAHLPEVFDQDLFKTLIQFGFEQAQIERMLDQTREIHWAKTNNRNVLGSMNDMKHMLEWSINGAGGLMHTDQADLTRLLNETAFKATGYVYPVDRLRQLLECL